MTESGYAQGEARKIEKRVFGVQIIGATLAYTGISLWLNAIRTTSPLWFVWVLIIIQFTLYFSIFITSWRRCRDFGLSDFLGFIIFLILCVLGRVNDWEIVIIPLVVIVMLIASGISKKQHMIKE